MSDAWITAAFGVLGTLAGGGLTAFVSVRQARHQQEAQERTQIRALWAVNIISGGWSADGMRM
ncbi:hypothetical protein WB388_32225 [Streptomyces brasiliscabiei]|uniref:Secreted protein n=1 Tax=Streptomyces brasiliscabiei TaxID=2736302 RepID=A0ABU8GGV7_9ACTN